MITSIKIERLRGIREGELTDLTPLVILVGPNGCGKSTVLDAMLLAGSPVPEQGVRRAVGRRRDLVEGAKWFLWRFGSDGQTRVRMEAVQPLGSWRLLELDEGTPATLEQRLSGQQADESREPTRFSINCGPREPGGGGVLYVHRTWPPAGEVALVDFSLAVPEEPLHRLYTKANEKGRRDEVDVLVRQLVPIADGLQMLSDLANQPILHVSAGRPVPLAVAGDGILASVRLALELANADDGLALLEEPEAHLHPAAIWQAAKVIWAAVRRGVQVVVSTHSLELIDALLDSAEDDLDSLSLYMLRLDDGRLVSSRLPGQSVRVARQSIAEDLR